MTSLWLGDAWSHPTTACLLLAHLTEGFRAGATFASLALNGADLVVCRSGHGQHGERPCLIEFKFADASFKVQEGQTAGCRKPERSFDGRHGPLVILLILQPGPLVEHTIGLTVGTL